MKRSSFNAHWGVRKQTSPFLELMGQATPPEQITLPHDWLVAQPRDPKNQPGALTGYHGEDVIEYVKKFDAPLGYEKGRVEVEFDGVYRGAMVYVNDSFVGQRPYGYIPFSLRIDQYLRDGENEIRVEARNHLDARWYSGLGIYRDVTLLVGGPVHVARNGVRVHTVTATEELAVLDVTTDIENDASRLRGVRAVTEIIDASGTVVAADSAVINVRPNEAATLRRRFTVTSPLLWGTDNPHLYTCRTRLQTDGEAEEVEETSFGVRHLEWDVVRGLRINGQEVKLRGGCIHHDNGVIGTATFSRAEERRVELLKEAGYNAIRSAHNPTSRRMLEACDRLGMLVLDELTDGWTSTGLGFGYGLDMPEWWRRDAQELVARDFNHPSVIMYSIGNEVSDTGNDWDAIRGRDMVDALKALDPTRPVTMAVNPMMTVLHDLKAQMGKGADEDGGVNSFMKELGESTQDLAASELATERLEEAMSQVDIAGYNYAYGRYDIDMANHPQRLILGTEGLPSKLDEIWPMVTRHPQVLGEFSWTAWEYVGEAGLGVDKPEVEGFFGTYPARLSGTADIGITGYRRTISYWRETVWGLRKNPYIAVVRPGVDRSDVKPSLYTWSDSVNSWSWPGHEGSQITVEVYSNAEEVALLRDGQLVGRRPVGAENRFIAEFTLDYSPGELVAVAYRDGKETGRSTLRTAGKERRLHVRPDRSHVSAEGDDLVYVEISVGDEDQIVHIDETSDVTVTVEGPGVLQGLGTDDPSSLDNYAGALCSLYRGRALAVVRPTGEGRIWIRVKNEGNETVESVSATRPAATPLV